MGSSTRPQKAIVTGTFVYVLLYVFVLLVHPGSEHFSDIFIDVWQALPPIFGGAAGIGYYRQRQDSNRARRAGWLLIALTCLLFSTGYITGAYLKSRGNEFTYPSWPDLFCLAAFLLLLTGAALLFGSRRAGEYSRRMFDSAIVAGSVGVLSWSFIVETLWQQSDASLLAKCISTAYPLGDIAVLFGAIALLWDRQYSRALRRSVRLLAAGMLGITFSDMAHAWLSLNGMHQTSSWIDAAMSFGWLLIGYSFLTKMWRADKLESEADESQVARGFRVSSVKRIVFPYVAVVAACLVVYVHDYTLDGRLDNSTVAAVAVLMLLVLLRQILALAENRSLTLELKTLNDNLERLVDERTSEVLALLEERDRFLRTVSHEIRTPLTSIIGFAEFLMEDEDEPLTARQKAQFQKVIVNAHKLLNMVNDLLDISKIEAGRVQMHYSAVKLDEMVSQVVENMMPIAQEKALGFRIDVSDDLPVLTTDERKLSHILVNLLSNAIKYTAEGTISVGARLNGRSISITVEDTGVGMPESELSRIFDEFYRIPCKSRQQGTGLGLTIVSKLTELLGGCVSVRSKEGEGSAFTLTLPVVPALSASGLSGPTALSVSAPDRRRRTLSL